MSILTNWNNFVYKLFNPTIAFISMAGLILYWIIKKRPASLKITKITFWTVLCSLIFQSLYLSILHLILWYNTPWGRALMPPVNPWSYSLHYVFVQYCKRNVFTIVGALLFMFIAYWFNKKYNEKFFYKEEIYLMGLSMLCNPWPGLIVLLIIVLFTSLIIQIVNLFLTKHKRISMLYLWLPCSLLSFFITYAILKYIPILNTLFV
jgi:uncharacterized protein YacL